MIGQAQIIDDLLDISRVRTGKLSVVRTVVDMREIVQRVCSAMREEAQERGIALNVTMSEAPVIVHADLTRIEQIVWNLISNALKFTARGSVNVSLQVNEHAEAVLQVADTGSGIEPALLPHIFSRVAVDNVRPFVGTEQRAAFNGFLRRALPGDELVVLDLSCLGSSARDVLATLQKCRKERIVVRCVELGNVDLASRPEPQAVKMLRAIVRLDMQTRSERSSTSLKRAQQSGKPTGRPGSLSPKDRGDVIGLLRQGVSVSEIARRFDTSRQTIMRIRALTTAAAADEAKTSHG